MIEQIGIVVFGVVAVFLSQSKSPSLQRYASVFGLLSQPFWFYATYTTQQWGMLALCAIYAGVWAMGFYNHWIRKI